jgi:hypothetical protein
MIRLIHRSLFSLALVVVWSTLAGAQITTYTVQFDAWPTREEAEDQVRQLKARNVHAYLARNVVSGKDVFYRVRAGVFSNQTDARKFGASLQLRGIVSAFFVTTYEKPTDEAASGPPPASVPKTKALPKTNQTALNSAPADAVDQFSFSQKLREFLGVAPDRQADEEAQAVQADEEAIAKANNKAIEDLKKALEQIKKDVDVARRPEPDTKRQQPRNPPRRHLDCRSLPERMADLERRAKDRKARAQRHDERRTALMARIREYNARGNAMSWKAPPGMADAYNAGGAALMAERDRMNDEAYLLNSEWERLADEARALDREWKECERLGVINGSPVKAKN